MVVIAKITRNTVSPYIFRVTRNLDRFLQEAVNRTVDFGVAEAKMLAPEKTGELINGITGLKNKFQGKIISVVSTSNDIEHIPYNFWVNQEPGFETITGQGLFFKEGEEIRYGDPSALSPPSKIHPKGRPINWTGKAKYFDKAAAKTRKVFKEEIDYAIVQSTR